MVRQLAALVLMAPAVLWLWVLVRLLLIEEFQVRVAESSRELDQRTRSS